jgi:hypothetical protein
MPCLANIGRVLVKTRKIKKIAKQFEPNDGRLRLITVAFEGPIVGNTCGKDRRTDRHVLGLRPARTESRLILFPARHGRIRRLSYFHALIVLG